METAKVWARERRERGHRQTIYQDSGIIYSKTKCKEDLWREGIFSAVRTNMIK